MYPFAPSVTPLVRTHMETQMSFANEVSKSLFRSFQQLCDLNIQLTQTLFEEGALASQQLLKAEHQSDVVGASIARAQPASEKLRTYGQHITRMAAETQADLARVAERHVQEATRIARAMVDEVQRATAEETERGVHRQQEAMRKFVDPFQAADASGQYGFMRGGNGSAGAGMSMQSAGGSHGAESQASQQSAQGGAQSATQGSASGSGSASVSSPAGGKGGGRREP
jgi:phasin family protein